MSDSNITTNVPAPTLTAAGYSAPSEQDILSGVQADINAAFGGNVNPALNTPQGQIAISETAILGDFLSSVLEVFNGMDPSEASGRMQDALGRIYFMNRKQATPTTVEVQLTLTGNGLPLLKAGTVVATDAISGGNLYALLSDTYFPAGTASPVSVELYCLSAGAIECPANSLLLYQGNLGIASLNNPSAGATGQEAEGRIDFENRRSASVAKNSMGQNASLLGALLALNGVTDAQVRDNPTAIELTIDGVTLKPNSVYAVVQGGNAQDIGKAILAKKPPGVQTSGNQSVTVTDNNPAYGDNPPVYTFNFDYAQSVSVFFNIVLANSPNVPNNAQNIIAQAIIAYFESPDTSPKLGDILYATDIIYAVKEACSWCRVLSLGVGTDNSASQNEINFNLNQVGVTYQNLIKVSLQ
ncbi:hypothetical protein FAI40_10005 [Acetobacteraceae bacterium]|nr:hypothetical protein FAI40_10005 [Acetobacteraceae bacterium]